MHLEQFPGRVECWLYRSSTGHSRPRGFFGRNADSLRAAAKVCSIVFAVAEPVGKVLGL